MDNCKRQLHNEFEIIIMTYNIIKYIPVSQTANVWESLEKAISMILSPLSDATRVGRRQSSHTPRNINISTIEQENKLQGINECILLIKFHHINIFLACAKHAILTRSYA